MSQTAKHLLGLEGIGRADEIYAILDHRRAFQEILDRP